MNKKKSGNDFEMSEEGLKKLHRALDAGSVIIDEYFSRPYEDLVRTKSYSDQQIACALIMFAYFILRFNRPLEQSSDVFDCLAHFGKARIEEDINARDKEPNLN